MKEETISQMDCQASFFNTDPLLYPWPRVRRNTGLKRVCTPCEAMWRRKLQKLGPREGDHILGIGCGEGIWLDRIANQNGVSGAGNDVLIRCLKMGKSESMRSHDLTMGDARRLRYDTESFDFLLCLDEAIMTIMSLLRKVGAIGSQGVLARHVGKAFQFSADRMSNQSLRFPNWLDKPWYKRGASSESLAVGREARIAIQLFGRLSRAEKISVVENPSRLSRENELMLDQSRPKESEGAV